MKKRWMLLVVTVMCFFALTACGNPQVKISGDEFEEIMMDEGFDVNSGIPGLSWIIGGETYFATHGQTTVYYVEADDVRGAKKMYKNIRSNIKEEMKRKYKEIDVIEDFFKGEGIVEITPN